MSTEVTTRVRPTADGLATSPPAQMAESLIIGLSCLAPWAIGAVTSWAVLGLDLGVALIGILTAASLWRSGRRWPTLGLPSLALAALVLLALLQATPLPPRVLQAIAPSLAARRAALVPAEPERLAGDERPPVPLPQATLSVIPGESLATATRLAATLVLFQCVLELGGGYSALRRFGLATCINATALALFALIQALSWNGKIFWIVPSPNYGARWYGGGPFVCHNHLAEYLNLGLGFAIGFLLSAGKTASARFTGRGSGLWMTYMTGILIVGILASYSRGGFLAMIAASGVTFVLLRLRFGMLGIRSALSLAIVFLIAFVVLAALGDEIPYLSRLATLFNSDDTALGARLSGWRYGLSAWLDHPIWGTGLGSFPMATAPYFLRDIGYFTRAENEYVDLLIEGGALGLALGLAALGAIIAGARRAWIAARAPREWGAVLGASFGGLAVAFHSLTDFGMHIPGVGFSVVVLAAHLYRLGLRPREADVLDPARRPGRPLALAFGVAVAAVMSPAIARQYRYALCDLALVDSRIPKPGTRAASAEDYDEKATDLERDRAALERSLARRPDWCEGHLWLGKVYLDLYRLAEERRAGGTARSTFHTSPRADPFRFIEGAKEGAPEESPRSRASRPGDPVHDDLVAAARCFLEARRCCPFSALAQAEIAGLAPLFERGDPPIAYAERAIGLTGRDEDVVDLIADLAVRIGRPELAASCWRRSLELRHDVWPLVADSAAKVLPPDQILNELLADGRHTVDFAERLYSAPKDRETREKFLRAALDRLPNDPGLEPSERLWLESQARAGLDQRDASRKLMVAALAAAPRNADWRSRYVEWLLIWGDAKEAHHQALAGVRLAPDHPRLRKALQKAVDAMARGGGRAKILGVCRSGGCG